MRDDIQILLDRIALLEARVSDVYRDIYYERIWKLYSYRNSPRFTRELEKAMTFRDFLRAVDGMPSIDEVDKERVF